jgi:hypothetical protein
MGTNDPIPPLLFCRPEPMPSDDEIREALEKWRNAPILIERPTLSVVNLSALAERIERGLRGAINPNGSDIDDAPETAGDRRAIYAAYDSVPWSLGIHDRFVKARTEFVLRLIRGALGGH